MTVITHIEQKDKSFQSHHFCFRLRKWDANCVCFVFLFVYFILFFVCFVFSFSPLTSSKLRNKWNTYYVYYLVFFVVNIFSLSLAAEMGFHKNVIIIHPSYCGQSAVQRLCGSREEFISLYILYFEWISCYLKMH